MKSGAKNNLINLIIGSAVINTLIITPFFNKDAIIIPKLIVMFCLALYLLPIIYLNWQIIFKSKLLKFFAFLNLMLFLLSLIVLILSSAPIEQQIFGRNGRGLGLITIISLSVVSITIATVYDKILVNKIILGLIFSGFITSLYSILQSFGIDFLKWDSKTNGVIGTLGNPNFQSAFAAMIMIPSLLYTWKNKKGLYFSILLFIFFIYTIYRTHSTQGIVAGFFSIAVTSIIYFWYKNKKLFSLAIFIGVFSSIFTIGGMLNVGPLSGYLYKVSVQSRGDFWRSAFNTANAHPFFGVGLDSFGDYSLQYRDLTAANHLFAEYTDNAHNFFLEQAATGGYILAIINSMVILLVIYSFFKIQRFDKKFEPAITSLFIAWIVFQMTSVISPGSLVTMFWNALISGVIIGQAASVSSNSNDITEVSRIKSGYVPGVLLGVVGFAILFPLFNTDRIQLIGMQKGDANLVMKAVTSYPESTVRYSLIGTELLQSGLNIQALEVARSGVQFNPHSAGLWALILVNQSATLEERNNAKIKILELDPFNKEVRNFTP
jgi:O-antigen ligase